jgi:geranylgeranyl diphosphate synthase type I
VSASSDPIEAVSQRLNTFIAGRRDEAAELGEEAALLTDTAGAAVEGGKRLRARFCLTGWRAVAFPRPGAPVPAEAMGVAAALEIFHAAALVHDDLIDNSDTRRGHPSAHRRLEGDHVRRRWHGDPAGFGRSGAILLGDLLVAWSDDLLEESIAGLPPERVGATRSAYAHMRRDVTVGQFLDVAEESAFVTQPDAAHAERALRVASLKSARYSIQQPLLIGAALAGADPDQDAALSAFGHPVGMAFQLRDDVLGVFGDASVTGKPSGDDLREGKRTVLVAYAREALPTGARHVFDELLGDRRLDGAQIASLQRTITETGALQRTEDLISAYALEADRALSGARLDNAAVGELRDLARAATARSA